MKLETRNQKLDTKMGGSVVITGGRGFVGQYLADELRRECPEVKVVAWDRPEVDITDPETYKHSLEELKPKWIVHLAAFSAVGESFKQAELVRQVNVEGTRKLLECIAAVSPDTRAIVASSADIYGFGTEEPLKELPLKEAKPKSPYARSKRDMEAMIEDNFNDRVIRVRPFPHIGPKQRMGFVTADFASQIAAIEKGSQLPVIKTGNLSARRDFTDVRDVARAYRLLLERGKTGEVYHVASGAAESIQTILDRLLGLSRVPVTVKPDPERLRPSDIPILVGDASKLKAATGWEPVIPLDQTLRDILEWWRQEQA